MVARSLARFRVLVTGRKFGKTALSAALALREASDGLRVGWFAPSYKQANEGWAPLSWWAAHLGARVKEADREIHFPNGGKIEVWTTDKPDYLRAPGWHFAVLDEAAYMKPTVWAKVIRPAMMATRGKAVFITSPNGRDWVHSLYLMGQNPAVPEWESWRFGSIENPAVSSEEVDALRPGRPGGMSDRDFRAEVLGEFVEAEGEVFRMVGQASTLEPMPPKRGFEYFTFVDLAETHDANGLVTMTNVRGPKTADPKNRYRCMHQVHVDRWFKTTWDTTEERIAAVGRRYRGDLAIDITGDTYSDPLVKRLQDKIGGGTRVYGIKFTNALKANMVKHLAAKLESSEVKLLTPTTPEAEAQRDELQDFQATRLPSGVTRYAGPQGKYDDMAIAVMAAAYMASGRDSTAGYDLVRSKLGGEYI